MLVDGIEVSDPSGVQVMPQIHHVMSGSSIGSVEILRGPQAFAYGADAGGVINIRSARPELSENSDRGQNASINLGLGSFSARVGDVAYSFTNRQFDLALSARRYETDGFNARLSDTALQDDDGYKNTTLHARIGWNLGEYFTLKASRLILTRIASSTGAVFQPLTIVLKIINRPRIAFQLFGNLN